MEKLNIGRSNNYRVSENLRLTFVYKHWDSFKSLADQGWHVSEKIIPLIHFLAADARYIFGYSKKSNSKDIVWRFLRLYKKYFVADAMFPIKTDIQKTADKVKELVIDYFIETGKCSMTKAGLAKVGALGQKCDDALLKIFRELIHDSKKIAAEKPAAADPVKHHSSKEVEKVGVEVAVLNELSASRSEGVNVEKALTVLAKEIDLIKQRS